VIATSGIAGVCAAEFGLRTALADLCTVEPELLPAAGVEATAHG
jgi:hypothetical protein